MDKYLNLPTFLISSYLIRLLVFGASIGDAIVMIVLGGLLAGHAYLEHIKEPEANIELKKRLTDLEESHTVVKNKVGAISLGSQMRK